MFLIIIIRIWYSSIGQCQPYWFVGWCFSTFQVYLDIFYNLVGLISLINWGRIFFTKYDFHKYWIVSGYHENYGIATRALLEEIVRKGIGIFILALLNSFLISAVIHYLQVCRIIFKHSQKLKNKYKMIHHYLWCYLNIFFRSFIGPGCVSKMMKTWFWFFVASTQSSPPFFGQLGLPFLRAFTSLQPLKSRWYRLVYDKNRLKFLFKKFYPLT